MNMNHCKEHYDVIVIEKQNIFAMTNVKIELFFNRPPDRGPYS